ncbi:MAG: hypothetical protein IMZ62_02640 [Chloroflexi bacterium]|nr:hypothetical protein [Chloroflexota bacterium]
MVLAETATANADGWGAILAAVVPILLGGVTTHFHLFIPAKGDFRRRTRLKRNVLCEKVATRLVALCQHLRCLPADDSLRGDGREEPDLVGEYCGESFRVFAVYRRLDILDSIIKYASVALYSSVVLGIAGALLAWLLPSARWWVLIVSVMLIGAQVLTVFVVQMACWKLDDYEDVT